MDLFILLKVVIGWLWACWHGGGGPQVGEVKYGGSPHLSCKRDQIKWEMRDCMEKRVTPPKRVTSPTWGPPSPCKQALIFLYVLCSFWKHWRARERSERARKKNKERLFSSSPISTSLRWRSMNPPVFYFLSRALDGLWRENRGSVKRLAKEDHQIYS